MKVCSTCKIEKEFSCFRPRKENKDGLEGSCKICIKIRQDKYKDRKNEKQRLKYINNKQYFIDKSKQLREKNREHWRNKCKINSKNFRTRQRDKIITVKYPEETHRVCKNCNTLLILELDFIPSKRNDKIYYYNKCRECRNSLRLTSEYYIKSKNSSKNRIRSSISALINNSIKKNKSVKKHSCLKYLNCSIDFFLEFIKSQFEENMTFDNYGKGPNKWSLDHYIPIAAFELLNEKEQKICHHWSNFRPLWNSENSQKQDEMPNGQLARKHKNKFSLEEKEDFIKERLNKLNFNYQKV